MHRNLWYDGESNTQKSTSLHNGDRDTALLFALIFILITDGGDERLIMALLYILS